MKTIVLLISLFSFSTFAQVESESTSAEFRAILEDTVGWNRNDVRWNEFHFMPKRGGKFDQALNAPSIEKALDLNRKLTLTELARDSKSVELPAPVDSDSILKTSPITVVIVPGVFGEFIPIDPFQEFFAAPSTFRSLFHRRVADTRKQLPSFLLRDGAIKKNLSDLIHVGSIRGKDGQELVPIIVFHTKEMSLESLGMIEDRAQIFSDRLRAYLELTGQNQKLLFVGYSRGTVIGLEMLARAEQNREQWLANVVGMVSLGGVVWGSSLADATDPNYITQRLPLQNDIPADTKKAIANTGALFQRLKEHRKNLIADAWHRPNNLAERFDFYRDVGQNALSGRRLSRAKPQLAELKNSSPVTLSVDASGMFNLAQNAWDQFSWNLFSNEAYVSDIQKYHVLLDSVINAAEGMQSSTREKWFADNTLPKHVTYYSVVAAMANPDASELEKKSFLGTVGYANRSNGAVSLNFDDTYLLQGRLDYESQTAIGLNDSQVASIQASFVPGAMERLNPRNRDLKTKFLGVMGTHHWGLALQVVNEMRQARKNPFPREALLKALAVQAAKDSRP